MVAPALGNDEVGPERTREIEFGFDGGFFDNRLSAEFTWYEQRTTDALFDVRQMPSTGNWNSQAANVGEIMTFLLALILLPGALLFSPAQILWINLVTDGVLDVTIAMEPKEKDVMNQPPRKPTTQIIDWEMIARIIFVATLMALGTLWMYFGTLPFGVLRAQTMAFITLAMFQIFNALNVRSRTTSVFKLGFSTNKYLLVAIFISFALLVGSTIFPVFHTVLHTVPLFISDWALILLVSSTILIGEEIRKLIWAKWRGNQ